MTSADKPNVLLVDDRADKLLALETILAPLPVNVVRAQSGKEALKLLLLQDFALIIFDVHMPEMSGLETAALVRQRQKFQKTPIIFVTAFERDTHHVNEAFALGAVDYISTPESAGVLRAKVERCLSLYQKEREYQRQIEELRGLLAQLETGMANLQADHEKQRAELSGQLEVRKIELEASSAAYEKQVTELREHLNRTGEDLLQSQANHQKQAGHLEDQLRKTGGEFQEARAELARLNETLGNVKQELAAFMQQTQQTFSFLSEDLGNELNGFKSFAHLLRTGYAHQLDADGHECIRRIGNSAARLDVVRNDLLEIIPGQAVQMDGQETDLAKTIQEALRPFAGELRKRKANVTIDKPWPKIRTHAPTVELVLSNLIALSLSASNPLDPPSLAFFFEIKEGGLRFWMADRNPAITADRINFFFGEVGPKPQSGSLPGTPAGLINLRLARMGGRAGVLYAPGEGNRFFLDMPIQDSLPARQPHGVGGEVSAPLLSSTV